MGFRDRIVASQFSNDPTVTVGIEFEAGGLRVSEVVEILTRTLHATDSGLQSSHWGMAHYLQSREFGIIRIEPVFFHRLGNTLEILGTSARTSRVPWLSRVIHWAERNITMFEVVTEPLRLEAIECFAHVLDVLGHAGAKGTGFSRPLSTQINIGIDPFDVDLMRNLLVLYYGNHSAIRGELRPYFNRSYWIRPIHPAFLQKLQDASWRPNRAEFAKWYYRYSKWKKSSLELSHALGTWAEHDSAEERPLVARLYPPRAAVEFREANTITSTPHDPLRTSRALMDDVRFAVALVQSARVHGCSET